jgi:glycosyltransferase involved in cell wall biosynthesis
MAKKFPDIIVLAPKGNFDTQGLKIKRVGIGKGVFWEQIFLPLFLMFQGKTLLINFCNTAPLLMKRQIITIHDLAFIKDEIWFSRAFRMWYKFLIPRLSKRSLIIITVSQFIKDEIITEFSIPENKIKIVHNSIPNMNFEHSDILPFRYLFLTGIYNKRKNASFVIELLPEIKKRGLHIVGVGSDESIYGNSNFQPDEHLHLLKHISDQEYYSLLKNAEALVFPSNYEGFGIPLLEALMLGTPVITTDIAVFRESFGDMPIYYQSGNAEMFLSALDKIKNHQPSTNDLSNLKNRFNFDKSSDSLAEIIRRIQN